MMGIVCLKYDFNIKNSNAFHVCDNVKYDDLMTFHVETNSESNFRDAVAIKR